MRAYGFIAILLASSVFAQDLTAPLFPRASYFRERFVQPSTHVELRAPVRLQDFVIDGKLELSLRNYLELVMENNTEIAIQRLTLETPKNAITRAFSVFDPGFVGTFNATRAKSMSTSVLTGAELLNQLNQRAEFTYQQTLPTGTAFNVGFLGTKASSNDAFVTFNPALNASLNLGFTQPLLRNRGSEITRLPISIARSQLRRSEYDFRDQLLRLISTAESIYWDVVEFRERLRVQEEFLKLADAALKRSQRELELGAIPELDIFQPQQQYANAEIQVSQFRFQLAQREDALRRQIGADLDPQVRNLPIVLTETVSPVTSSAPVDAEAAVQRALSIRPDIRSLTQTLDIDDLNIKSATNAMRPELNLTAGYTARGRGGTYYQTENAFGERRIVAVIPGGFGDALNQVFGFDVPTYQFGLTLRLPLRDRRAAADLADALVRKKNNSLRVRSAEQAARLEVLNAINQLESSKAGVRLASVARDFAQKNLDAEQKKYDLGASYIYFVLQAQTQLTSAEATLVTQSINYRRAMLNLLRTTGELLDDRGIVVQ